MAISKAIGDVLPNILVDLSFAYLIIEDSFDPNYVNKLLLKSTQFLRAIQRNQESCDIKWKAIEVITKASDSISSIADTLKD